MEAKPLHSLNGPIDSIEFALKGLNMRSKAIAGNIANINTPGYKRKEVHFEEILQKQSVNETQINTTNSLHLLEEVNQEEPFITTETNSFNVDGNSINIDQEMLELSKTGLRFKALSTLAKKHFDNIRGIIRG